MSFGVLQVLTIKENEYEFISIYFFHFGSKLQSLLLILVGKELIEKIALDFYPIYVLTQVLHICVR